MLTIIICVVVPVLFIYNLLAKQHPRDSRSVMCFVLGIVALFGFVLGICLALIVGAIMPRTTITEQAVIIQIDAPECRKYFRAIDNDKFGIVILPDQSRNIKITVSDELDDTILVVTKTQGANRNSFLANFALALPDYDSVLSTQLEVPLHPSLRN